jgi:hypothetical protein
VEKDQLPRRSRRLLKLPPHLESLPKLPSKRRKGNKRGTYISTSQTCDYLVMSIESNPNDITSPSTPIPSVVSGIPLTPSAMMVGVLEIPSPTATQPVVSTRPIGTNPFEPLFGTPGYNSQSIPSVSNPFSFGMPNMTSELSSSSPTTNANPSFGLGGMAPLHALLSFGGGHIPQTNPMVGGQPRFYSGSNPSLNALGWSTQSGRQVTSYIPSFTPSSSMPIPTNTFVMTNPPLSSGVPPGGSQFHAMGNPNLELLHSRGSQFHAMDNPHPRAPPIGGSVYNPHYVASASMVPIQPFMNQFGGGYYPIGQGHDIYPNLGWLAIPQHQSFTGAWAQTPQPRLPFLATLNLPDLSKLMNDPVRHDPSWLPIPTKLPSDIPKFEGKTSEDPDDHVTTFHLWCSSNSLNDNSIRLRLFQCTLMGVAAKWYIELPGGTYGNFNQMVLVFLNYFQLLVCYDAGT